MNNLTPLVIVALVLALFTSHREVHWLVYTVGLLGYGIRQLEKRSWKQMVFSRTLAQGKWFAGDPISLVVTLANPSIFPVFWGAFYQSLPAELGAVRERQLFTLAPRSQKQFRIQFAGISRGVFPLPETRIVVGDAWGGPEQVRRLEDLQQVLIFPRIFPLVRAEGERHLPLGRLKVMFGLHEDPARLRGCRDYAPGDSMKRIHWPNLARTGRLQVKEWESTLNADFIIFLDLREASYPVNNWMVLQETAIEIAASVNHRLVNEGERVGLVCNGQAGGDVAAAEGVFKLMPRWGRDQEVKALSYLAGVKLSAGQPLERLLGEGERLGAGACLILITPTVSAELAQRAGALRTKGYHPLVLTPQADGVEGGRFELAKARVPSFYVEKGRESHVFTFREN